MKLRWAILLAPFMGLMWVLPGMALPPNQSDITGIGVNSTLYVRFGFEPLEKSGLVTPAIQALQTAIVDLLNTDGISANTRNHLTALSERLKQVDTRLWDTNKSLDVSIQDIAKGLAQDLANAKAACNANSAASCDRLNQLIPLMQNYLDRLEQFRVALFTYNNVARIF
ncbi:MAG: hypothetical protein SFW36_15900 [Leptolyngbyaceae cyanobacterium bins.59]|nr:hypothetical protein [Leptolyngbyaceae cyanobacterium bins.59]